MLRRRMMMAQGGVSLPAGYTKVEYLESDGNSYIDTGFKPNQDTRVVMDAQYNSTTLSKFLFGCRTSNSTNMFGIYTSTTNNSFIGVYNATQLAFSVSDLQSKRKFDQNKNVCKIGDKELNATYASFASSLNMYLFACNAAGETLYCSHLRLYSCKIYDNGVLVRDFIPCTNPDGISGLWDSVNNVFYKMLPADYTRLDFIESDGNHYIDTGFKPNQDSGIKLDIQVTKSATSFLFGARANTSSESFSMPQISGSSLRMDYGPKLTTIAINPLQRLNIDVNKNVVTINGNITTVPSQTFQSQYSLYLLSVNTAGTLYSTQTAARIYSCQIYDNGTLVRDFIPAMNASGEAGLFDLKNDVWYALKPVETKKKNKITAVLTQSNNIWVTSALDVTTDITVKVAGHSRRLVSGSLQIYYWTEDITINVGDDTGSIKATGLTPTIDGITSISPTEDDTYIYTF